MVLHVGKNAKRRREAKARRAHGMPRPAPPPRARAVGFGWERAAVQPAPKHWFAPRTHEQLDERMLNKLGLIWAAIHVRDVVPGPGGRMVEKSLVDIQFRYRYLTDQALAAIEENGIPARSATAIKFSYPDVLLPCVPDNVNKDAFFEHLIDVLYCYWSIIKGFAFLHYGGLITQAERSRLNMFNFATFIERTEGVPRDQVLRDTDQGLDVRLMDAKWFADATMAKMRAFWDKIVPWLGNDYFGAKIKADKWGDRSKGKVGELAKNALDKLPEGPQKALLGAFVAMCCELGELGSTATPTSTSIRRESLRRSVGPAAIPTCTGSSSGCALS
jgi:hypothetical protein